VFIEYFTKWMITIPFPDVNAEVVADMLFQHVYQNFGPPEEILTDNASYFVAEGFKHFIDVLGSKHLLPSGYHPQCNGLVERKSEWYYHKYIE
jgi:transposase InsO family protein